MARQVGAGSYLREDSETGDDVIIEDEDKAIGPAEMCCPNLLSCFMSTLFFPSWACSARVIDQNELAAVLYWGRYTGSLTEPGIYLLNPCGVELRKVSSQRQVMQIESHKCADSAGNPIIVSVNVIYRIVNVKAAAVNVNMGRQATFLHQVVPMVLRRVCAAFPFDSHGQGPCLRGNPGDDSVVSRCLQQGLQAASSGAGVEIERCEFTDLSYAPEIAAAMLQRQQAQAIVDARKVMVQSAVDISSQAIQRMKTKGHNITPQGEERIISNLLTVICGHGGVQTTLPV